MAELNLLHQGGIGKVGILGDLWAAGDRLKPGIGVVTVLVLDGRGLGVEGQVGAAAEEVEGGGDLQAGEEARGVGFEQQAVWCPAFSPTFATGGGRAVEVPEIQAAGSKGL